MQNTNITSLKIGPQNLVLSENEKLVSGPTSFVKIPPGHFCVVLHPLDKKYACPLHKALLLVLLANFAFLFCKGKLWKRENPTR